MMLRGYDEVIESLWKLEGPDRFIDLDLGRLWRGDRPFNISRIPLQNGMPICPPFTASVDAIIRLIDNVLPGWAYKMGTCSVSDDAWLVPDFNCPVHGPRLKEQFGEIKAGSVWDTGIDIDRRPPGSIPIALCIALVSALKLVFESESMKS